MGSEDVLKRASTLASYTVLLQVRLPSHTYTSSKYSSVVDIFILNILSIAGHVSVVDVSFKRIHFALCI